MVSSYAQQDKDRMSVVPFHCQDPSCFGRKTWDYRNSNKDMHNSLSIALGKSQYYHLNCHLLLKECYY